MSGDDRERLKGHLDLLLLSVLARGPAHGYAVISALRRSSSGAFDLPEGTVYPALHRLERAGLLIAQWHRAGAGETADGGAPTGRRRKVYALTADGEAALAAEQAQWRRFRTGVRAVLEAGGATA